MTNFITKKVGQFDSASVAICRQFLDSRYRMVWDAFFWKDTEMLSNAFLTAGNATFMYPAGMDRIATIRAGGDHILDPVEQSFLIESFPTIFQETGTPLFYDENTTTPQAYAITVYPTPNKDTDILIFGKRSCPGLSNDDDVSMLRNCDNCIIAYATGDMLERQRQYGKAQAKFTEAGALLEEAKQIEQTQANQPRKTKMLTVTGNSLAEMTDGVAGVCNAWTPDMTILIKEFLRRNYQALYDLNLWPESIVVFGMPEAEQLILPEYVDKVIGVRGRDKLSLQPAQPQLLLGISPSIFDTMGSPVSYSILTSVGLAVLPGFEQLDFVSSSPLDVGKKVFIRGESQGNELSETVVLNGMTMVTSGYQYDVPLTVSKEKTAGDISVHGHVSTFLYEKLFADEFERKHIRLWLLNPPQTSTAEPSCHEILILGKRRIRPLINDIDTPIISGCQQVLIAGAAADLFSRMGNADGANTQRAKADASAKILTQLHTDQSSYSPRFVPRVEPYAYTRDGGWGIW